MSRATSHERPENRDPIALRLSCGQLRRRARSTTGGVGDAVSTCEKRTRLSVTAPTADDFRATGTHRKGRERTVFEPVIATDRWS